MRQHGWQNGYVQIGVYIDGVRVRRLAHRLAYETWVGPIPDGHVVDHLCFNKGCIEPTHLEAVTQRENVQRAIAHYPDRPVRTHSKRGHPCSGECLECKRQSQRRRDERRRHPERLG